jgi:hypothetical protein
VTFRTYGAKMIDRGTPMSVARDSYRKGHKELVVEISKFVFRPLSADASDGGAKRRTKPSIQQYVYLVEFMKGDTKR